MGVVEYYLSLNSPWTYLGHDRFVQLAIEHALEVAIFPVDYSVIFPVTGGLPVGQRAMARQRYRLMELRRWREFHNKTLNLRPACWPADESLAASVVVSCRDRPRQCLKLIGAIQTALWAQDLDIADERVLIDCANHVDIDGVELLRETRTNIERLVQVRLSESRAAIDKDVFGAPTYRYKKEIFWGQDRLDFLQSAISRDT